MSLTKTAKLRRPHLLSGKLARPNICLTFDVEEWSLPREYGISYANITALSREGCKKLIKLLKRYGIKSTFFVTGYFAEREPQTVKRLIDNGHEVACHAYQDVDHTKLSENEMSSSLKQATEILSAMLGRNVAGFRSPFCKLNEKIFSLLEKLGYKYDSSIHPTIIPGYYHNQSCPLDPYFPDRENILSRGNSRVLEMPISVIPLLRFPISWWWMRNFGVWLTCLGTKINLLQRRNVVLYFHAWEFVKNPQIGKIPSHLTRKTGKPCLSALNEFIKRFENYKFKKMVELIECV